MSEPIEQRPILAQGSEAPIIIREGENLPPLLCESCNDSVLVENYLAECFVGIGLECFRCKHVTITPSLPEGEVFPGMVVSLGSSNRYLIGSSVSNRKDVVLTCDQELEKSKELTAPNKGLSDDFQLDVENLNKLADELNVVSGGRFEKYIDSAKRSIERGNKYFRTNPLAWSIELLKEQIQHNTLWMSDRTLVALGFLQAYRDIVGRWKNHLHFPDLAVEICAYFYHSLFNLIVASHFFDSGYKIAINVAGKENGERSADLYLRFSATKKIFLEVKAPEALEWVNVDLKPGKMKKVIERCLSGSRGQIDINKPGVLVIGSTCLRKGFLDEFKATVNKVLKARGKSYPGIAGVCVVALDELSAIVGHSFSTSFQVSFCLNDHYFEENPLKI